ncbi:MAG: type II toxin-antitoxin system death-on-curing family toxin [Acidobacteria bacterium]|nr:type II toxin-antitoxin system death-on-curing family toxin [Acidobacteriota bacterium]
MKRPVWIYRETVLILHEQLLAAFGGSSGIRDNGLLESALARPKNLLAYGKPDVFDLAASYGAGLVKNHPFVDGNKRTGFAVAVLFLELNGYRFEAGEADATVRTLALAAGDLHHKDYAAWLKANARRVRTRR